GRLFQGQAAEEAQLDELGFERVMGYELFECLVQGEEFFVRPGLDQGVKVRVGAAPSAPVLDAPFATGVLDQDAAHGLGGGGKEVGPAVPVLGLSAPDQPQVGLV